MSFTTGSAATATGRALVRTKLDKLVRASKHLLRAGLCALVLVQADACAQAARSTPKPMAALKPAEAEIIHNELRALKAAMERALNAMDVNALVAHVTDDVIFTTMNGDVARGHDGIRKYFETMMKGPDPRVRKVVAKFEAEDLSNLYGRDFAVAFGSSKDSYEIRGGQAFNVAARWSSTMVRRDGRWLIANFHYSSNMFDNAILDAQRKYLTWVAVAAATVLALLAFWLGRAYGKKSTK